MGRLSSKWGGVFAVSAFVIFWFNFPALLFGSQKQPSAFSPDLIPGLVVGTLFVLGPVLLFLFGFVKRYEKKQSFKATIASLAWNREGVRRSLLWAVPFFALIILSQIIISEIALGIFGPSVFTYPYQSSLPPWYGFFTIIYSVFSSLTEETVGVGYIVDRLMPSHPAPLRKASGAVLVRSLVAVLYHLTTYLVLFRFSLATAMVNFVSAFVSFAIIGYAYVRSNTRNIAGPWALHYLQDVLMVLETYRL